MSDGPGAKVLEFPSKRPVVADDEDGFLSVIDMLELLLEDLKLARPDELPTGIFIGMYKDGDDLERFPYYNHGLSRLELLGLLTQYMQSVL